MKNKLNNKGKTSTIVIITVSLIILACLVVCVSDGGSSSSSKKYKDTLNSGLQKYYSGESMDKDEYNAVKNFNKWKYNNSKHSYNSWNSNY